nr:histidinol-phosphate transaminase [uncultured Dethiosulfovibrio sp.]
MRPLPVSSVRNLLPVVHGGVDYQEIASKGLKVEDIVDFSVSINPFLPHEEVLQAALSSELRVYPDRYSGALRDRLASLNGVEPSSVIVTNGASQAIWLVAMAYLKVGRKASVVAPAYGEYVAPSIAMGAEISMWDFSRSMLWGAPDMDTLLCDQIVSDPPTILWLCSPNNPTGYTAREDQIGRLIECCSVGPTILVVDEAYRNFMAAPPRLESFLSSGRLILLRSMTKDYGLPGVRLGYALGSGEAINAMRSVQPDWSVGAQAQSVGMAVLDKEGYYREQWRDLRAEKARLFDSLRGMGITVIPGEANFVLCHHPRSDEIMAYLKGKNILVRDCRSFGLEGFFRIGVKTRDVDDVLLGAISSFFANERRSR